MKNKSGPFSIERKGYNRFEVEQSIKRLESEKAMLSLEIEELKRQLANVIAQNNELEKNRSLVEDTLINAHLAAQDIVRRAEERAEEIADLALEKNTRAFQELKEKEKEAQDTIKRVEYVLKSQLALLEKE
ncbi:MAG: hypothetical protein IKB86_03125 [Clostridia bacterium]|nr:hypothetical protein [Clostridia bacterium]